MLARSSRTRRITERTVRGSRQRSQSRASTDLRIMCASWAPSNLAKVVRRRVAVVRNSSANGPGGVRGCCRVANICWMACWWDWTEAEATTRRNGRGRRLKRSSSSGCDVFSANSTVVMILFRDPRTEDASFEDSYTTSYSIQLYFMTVKKFEQSKVLRESVNDTKSIKMIGAWNQSA